MADVCPRCKGQGGLGTFGPCGIGTIHFKRSCPLCNGSTRLPIGCAASTCAVCNAMGGLGTFGPCEIGSVHFKSECTNCFGKGYSLVNVPGGFSNFTQPGYGAPGYGAPGYGAPPQTVYGGGGYSSFAGAPPATSYANGGYSTYPSPQPAYPTPNPGMNINISGPGGFGITIGGSPHNHHHHAKGHTLVSSSQSRTAPMQAVLGRQNDGAGHVACAVAHTAHGDIPGKAKDGTCWYPYGGKEHSTGNFSWVVIPGHSLQKAHHPPPRAVAAGFQNDGAGTLYLAIAETNHGTIPGKAKDNTCWYSYGGVEHSTNRFSWVCQ